MKQYNLKRSTPFIRKWKRREPRPERISRTDLLENSATRDIVMQKEVQLKLYWQAGEKELKDYTRKTRLASPSRRLSRSARYSLALRAETDAVGEKERSSSRSSGRAAILGSLRPKIPIPVRLPRHRKTDQIKDLRAFRQITGPIKNKAKAIADPIEADQVENRDLEGRCPRAG